MIYIGLYIGWGISIHKRVVQKAAKNTLIFISGLMIFWFIVRSIKYFFAMDVNVERYLWYSYYLPMLFIPLLGVYIALSLGQPERYRITGKSATLVIFPTVLFLFVITNDLHQQVFAFQGGVLDSGVYTHRSLYFACLGWMVACMSFSLVRFFQKSRMPGGGRKRLLPFVLGCAMVLYGLLYLSGLPAVRWWLGDMNVMFCLLYAAIYESCIQCRLIQSNTGYVALFEATTLAACIADQNGQIVLRSQAAGENMICPPDGQSVLHADGIRISSAPIGGGYVIWQDNVRPLIELHTRLDENRAEMERNKSKLQNTYLVQKKLHELTEKSRIYDELEEKHRAQTAQIQALLARCRDADPAETRILLKRILLLGTYIKRSANLYFLSREYDCLPQQELRLTVDEAVRALIACGTDCGVVYRTTGPMRSTEVVRLLDLLKTVAEMTIDELHSLFISVSDSAMDLSVECAADLSPVAAPETTVLREDGLWLIRTQIGGQNDA